MGSSRRNVFLAELEPKPVMSMHAQCNGILMKTMVDSGSPLNVITASAFSKLPLTDFEPLREELRGVEKSTVNIIGRIKLDCVLHDIKMKCCTFYVLDSDMKDYEVLLGINFLQENELSINVNRQRISGQGPNGSLWELYIGQAGRPCTKIVHHMPCKSKNAVTVRAGESSKIFMTLPDQLSKEIEPICPNCKDADNRRSALYFEPKLQDEKTAKVFQISPGIIDKRSPWIPVYIDYNDGAQKLKKDCLMGYVYTIIEMNCEVMIDENSNNQNLARVYMTNIDEERIEVGDLPLENEWSDDKITKEIILKENLSDDEKVSVRRLIKKHIPVLSQGSQDIRCANMAKFRIELYDDTPIYQRVRRFPEPVTQKIEEHVRELQEIDAIEASQSPWNSPVVPITKKNGDMRLCIDYRKLNAVTKPDKFPMMNLTDAVYSMHGIKYFTTLDLVRGYYQMPISPGSRECTAFSTQSGHWQFKRLSFGLRNAPAAFQRQMQSILADFNRNQVIVFIDDVIMMHKTFDEHLKLVDDVLQVLKDHDIKIKTSKCEWFRDKVEFLGHIVSSSGISKTPKFLEDAKNYPKPKTVKELHSYLGWMNFQRKFVERCAEKSKPLTEWTSKPGKTLLKWTKEMDDAFEILQKDLQKELELAYPDYSDTAEPLQLWVDASNVGAGATLTQLQGEETRIIYHGSMTFSAAQRSYSTIERELAALRWGVKSLRSFLYGVHFVLRTDHQPLQYLHNMKLIDGRLARTMEDLADFDFEIRYTPGKDNQAADALSRMTNLQLDNRDYEELSGLPVGLSVRYEPQGGGNSMIECLFEGYKTLKAKNLTQNLRIGDSSELRKKLVDLLLEEPSNFGLQLDKFTRKALKLMRLDGQLPSNDVLMVASMVFQTTIFVHFGGGNPIVYQHPSVNSDDMSRLHLQCLAGIHFNLLQEKSLAGEFLENGKKITIKRNARSEESIEKKDHLLQMVEENQVMAVAQINDEPVLKPDCGHRLTQHTFITVGCCGNRFCGLLDSGAEISLVSQEVITKLQSEGNRINLERSEVNVRAIGERIIKYDTFVKLVIDLAADLNVPHQTFLVVPADSLPYCFLLGTNLQARLDMEIDFGQKMSTIHKPLVGDMDVGGHMFIGQVLLQDNDSMDDIRYLQKQDSMMRSLRWNIKRGVQAKFFPEKLKLFKRYTTRMEIKNDLLMVERDNPGRWIPVVPFGFAVDYVVQHHGNMSHIGRQKLWEMVKIKIFHPKLYSIVHDVATTCTNCQRSKIHAQVIAPPVIKIYTENVYDLVAVDLVALPRTRKGFVAMLMAVDHKSKWVTAVPIRDKTSRTVASALETRVLTSLLKIPCRILSDNGPEFIGMEFKDVLNRYGIKQVYTTPNHPPSNGACERVNRTIGEFLRSVTSLREIWDENLPKVVVDYNHTWHSELETSPADYLLGESHKGGMQAVLPNDVTDTWRPGHPNYCSFKVGQLVMKKQERPGNRVEDKLKDRFIGPYKVTRTIGNGVTYVIKDEKSGKEIRAHHTQLREWKSIPQYLQKYSKSEECYSEDEVLFESMSDSDNDFVGFGGGAMFCGSDDDSFSLESDTSTESSTDFESSSQEDDSDLEESVVSENSESEHNGEQLNVGRHSDNVYVDKTPQNRMRRRLSTIIERIEEIEDSNSRKSLS